VVKVTNKKNCYCVTCQRAFHYLGIAKHRAAHRKRGEYCEIIYTDGRTFVHDFRGEEAREP